MKSTAPKPDPQIEPTPPKTPSKVDATYGQLLNLAHRLGPHAKMPTVRALRGEMNVSQATLDSALSLLEGQNVLVRRQGSGVYVSHRLRQRNIALVCDPDFFFAFGTSPFWSLLVDQIRKIADDSEANLSLHFLLPWKDADLLRPVDPSPLHPSLREDIATGRVHGVLGIGAPHPVTRWIEARNVPVVAYAGPARYMLGHSETVLVQRGVAELARQGCRRIEIWFHTESVNSHGVVLRHESLYEVYRGAMLAHDLSPLPAQRQSSTEGNGMAGPEEGFRRALHRFGPRTPVSGRPDAILSTNDILTQGILMALYRLGIMPDTDVKIATHANAGSGVLLGWNHQITRLEYDLTQLVRLLFETLDALIGGEKPSWQEQTVYSPEVTYLLQPRLVRPQTENDTPTE
ncbi:MAG: LacI family DNA-binding transcriptional regulator [Akkermansiaceae bacterium]|nr:LacI family DNA-binding transcriptional regulator [Armatimonadota bacterium]